MGERGCKKSLKTAWRHLWTTPYTLSQFFLNMQDRVNICKYRVNICHLMQLSKRNQSFSFTDFFQWCEYCIRAYEARDFVTRQKYLAFYANNNFFVGVPHLATYIFLFIIILNQNWVTKIDSGMAFTPFPSSILDEIWTHNLKIMSRVR